MGRGRGLALAALLAVMVPLSLAARADAFVYWGQGVAVGRANLDGTGVNQSSIAPAGSPQGVAVDGQHVYWTNFFTNSIGRANLDGSGVNQSFISPAAAVRRGWRSTASTSTGPTTAAARSGARTSTAPASIRASSAARAPSRGGG